MKRTWLVRPEPGHMEVSRQAMVEAFMDAEAILARAGGVLSVLVGREPTGIPGEMVTTQAVFEWKDRTDAKPQPEPAGNVIAEHDAAPAPEQPPEDDVFGAELEPELAAVGAVALGEQPDEDLSSIPEELR